VKEPLSESLLKRLQDEQSLESKANLLFQVARALRNEGQLEESLSAYQARAEIDLDKDERFVSLLERAQVLIDLNATQAEVLNTLERASEVGHERAEALHAASRYCRNLKLFSKGVEYAAAGLGRSKPLSGLDLQDWIYDWALLDEFAVNSYWSGDFRSCADACRRLLSEGKLPESRKSRVEANLQFANEKLGALRILELEPGDPANLLPLDALTPWAQAVGNRDSVIRCIHIVWVGDESRRPDNCIQTWRDKNPDWQIRIWGNKELRTTDWKNRKHIESMLTKELAGVADLMRWEILYAQGGLAVDADSACVRPLEDWLFEPDIFAAWENEWLRPGLVASGYVYARPGNRLMGQIIEDLHNRENMEGGRAWQITGPTRLTDTIKSLKYRSITVYPSHFFMPEHLSGARYTGNGPVFAKQFWGSTRGNYKDLSNWDAVRSTSQSNIAEIEGQT